MSRISPADKQSLLQDACKVGDVDFVKILAKDISLIAPFPDGSYPIHEACDGGNLAVIDFLLRSGLNVDAVDRMGRTALHWVCYTRRVDYENLAIAEMLMASGANLNKLDSVGSSPLHVASDQAHNTLVMKLISQEGFDRKTLHRPDGNGLSAIQLAHRKNNLALVSILVAASVDPLKLSPSEVRHTVNSLLPDGTPVLHELCKRGDTHGMNAFMALGADPNRRNATTGDSLVMAAIRGGHAHLARQLLKIDTYRGENNSGMNFIMLAAYLNKTEVLNELLEDDAVDLDMINYKSRGLELPRGFAFGDTAAIMAARMGHRGPMKALLEIGAKIDESNLRGETAAVAACKRRDFKMLKLLIDHKRKSWDTEAYKTMVALEGMECANAWDGYVEDRRDPYYLGLVEAYLGNFVPLVEELTGWEQARGHKDFSKVKEILSHPTILKWLIANQTDLLNRVLARIPRAVVDSIRKHHSKSDVDESE